MLKMNGPWTITQSSSIYQNDFMSLREDRVIHPNGQPGVFGVVTLPLGVAVLPMDDDGFVYLASQPRYVLERTTLEVPSGSCHPGEAPEVGVRRELKEELGITTSEIIPMGITHSDTSIVWSEVHLFLAKGLRLEKSKPDAGEVIHMVKLPFTEAVQKVMSGEITAGPSCTLILKVAVIVMNSA